LNEGEVALASQWWYEDKGLSLKTKMDAGKKMQRRRDEEFCMKCGKG